MKAIRSDSAGPAPAATLVCSWCRSVISASPEDGVKNYGMCRSCLSHNLQRLEVADRGGRDDGKRTSPEGRLRRVS